MNAVVAIVGRDRAHLVERCLESLRNARNCPPIRFYRDPLTVEYDQGWLFARGATTVVHPTADLEPAPRRRVAALRVFANRDACDAGRDLIVHMDSDIVCDPGLFERLEEMWDAALRLWPREQFALAPANFAGYAQPGFCVSDSSPYAGLSVRTHGLGGCLAFRCTPELAAATVTDGASWDSNLCRRYMGRRVLTSDVSYVRHIGRRAGMCVDTSHPDLDWHNFTPALENE